MSVSYNCSCDDAPGYKTLGQLSTELMTRLGFAAQTLNPPPGMLALCHSFLSEAQELLYRRYSALRTERTFTWPLVAGTRFYDLDANSETCTKRLDAYKRSWVGWSMDGANWRSLREGIDSRHYGDDGTDYLLTGQPECYAVRQCVEIWPAPDVSDTYSLRIRGYFGLESFTKPDDQTTLDDRMVFLLALANAKAHYGAPDANNYSREMEVMLSNLVAGSHGTQRYIPGQTPPAPYVQPKPKVPFA